MRIVNHYDDHSVTSQMRRIRERGRPTLTLVWKMRMKEETRRMKLVMLLWLYQHHHLGRAQSKTSKPSKKRTQRNHLTMGDPGGKGAVSTMPCSDHCSGLVPSLYSLTHLLLNFNQSCQRVGNYGRGGKSIHHGVVVTIRDRIINDEIC
jgi:hypothetical protein